MNRCTSAKAGWRAALGERSPTARNFLAVSSAIFWSSAKTSATPGGSLGSGLSTFTAFWTPATNCPIGIHAPVCESLRISEAGYAVVAGWFRSSSCRCECRRRRQACAAQVQIQERRRGRTAGVAQIAGADDTWLRFMRLQHQRELAANPGDVATPAATGANIIVGGSEFEQER